MVLIKKMKINMVLLTMVIIIVAKVIEKLSNTKNNFDEKIRFIINNMN